MYIFIHIFIVVTIFSITSYSKNIKCEINGAETVCESQIFQIGDKINNGNVTTSTLKFKNCTIKNVYVDFIEHTKQLAHLHLHGNKVEYISDGAFKNLGDLNTMTISINPIEHINADTFQGLERLKTLYSCCNNFNELRQGTFKYLKSLTFLDLGDNRLVMIGSNAFSGLSNLEELYLHSNGPIHNSNGAIMKLDFNAFSGLFKLNKLTLYNNQFIVLPLGLFKDLHNLKYLDLSKNRFSKLTNGLFRGLAQLETLDIFNNNLESLNEYTFASLVKLQNLNVSNNLISVIETTAFLAEVPNLQTISFDGNNFKCKLLGQIIRKFKDREVNVTDGSSLVVANINGISCYDDDEVTEREMNYLRMVLLHLNQSNQVQNKLISKISEQNSDNVNDIKTKIDNLIANLNKYIDFKNCSSEYLKQNNDKHLKILTNISDNLIENRKINGELYNELQYFNKVFKEMNNKHFDFENSLMGELNESSFYQRQLPPEIFINASFLKVGIDNITENFNKYFNYQNYLMERVTDSDHEKEKLLMEISHNLIYRRSTNELKYVSEKLLDKISKIIEKNFKTFEKLSSDSNHQQERFLKRFMNIVSSKDADNK